MKTVFAILVFVLISILSFNVSSAQSNDKMLKHPRMLHIERPLFHAEGVAVTGASPASVDVHIEETLMLKKYKNGKIKKPEKAVPIIMAKLIFDDKPYILEIKSFSEGELIGNIIQREEIKADPKDKDSEENEIKALENKAKPSVFLCGTLELKWGMQGEIGEYQCRVPVAQGQMGIKLNGIDSEDIAGTLYLRGPFNRIRPLPIVDNLWEMAVKGKDVTKEFKEFTEFVRSREQGHAPMERPEQDIRLEPAEEAEHGYFDEE